MLVWFLDILICFMALGITMFAAQMVENKSSTLNNLLAISVLLGILLVGTGIYIGMGGSLHAYLYITFILQLIILGLLLLIYRLFKKVGYSKLISICSLCLLTISHLTYVYYIIGSFIYY
ncbi:hypothetical protein ACIGC1_10395 [Peribacillus butanolivorans]|uniref:hypothetical protein n=1 Tax=Peribacillus butanolivorans TaxID=421767 RepID=UPI0037CC6A9F